MRKRVPIVGRQLSKPEELREAKLSFDRRCGSAGPVCRFIAPETQDAAGRAELLGEPLPHPPVIRSVILFRPWAPRYWVRTFPSSPAIFAIATASKMDSAAAPAMTQQAR